MQEELKKYDEGRKYPYEQLKGKSCPQGVNPTMKEVGRPTSSSPFCIASCGWERRNGKKPYERGYISLPTNDAYGVMRLMFPYDQ